MALVFILFLVVLSFTAKFIAPYGINDFDYNAIMQAPTAAHWFGTDEFGRDLFSRIICGTGISLSVGLFSVSIAAVIGSFLGLIGGYYGGIIDSIIMRICDALFAFPGIILAASSLSFLGMGAQPPTPEWGLLLSNGRTYMMNSWHITLFPGLAIFLTVLSFNLLGDGLRDALDPKLTD